MPMFRKKPVVIEAVQFTGDNHEEAKKFCPTMVTYSIGEEGETYLRANPIIPTLEGEHLCTPGDWIIKGVKGEFYPCKPDIFDATYEPA